jgi:DNA helicase II / ATP-dependent DNA helicase PcrA
MSATRKELELEDERTAEKRYAKKLRDKANRPVTYEGPRNLSWTGDGLRRKREVPIGELFGRVALQGPDQWVLDGSSDFYIGEKHADLDGIEVFNWTAPIACTFFRGTKHHKLCEDVAVIRTLVHRNGQIVDFTDDVMRDDAPDQPFRKRGLSIPEPPNRPSPPLRDVPRPSEPVSVGDGERAQDTPPRPPTSRPHRHADRGVREVRAEDALRAQLQAPRTKSLTPVLSTLQPEQYELVTVPAMDSMIIEGKPGTGKTIIASHRAAYLVNDDTPPENALDGNVLLIGPTTGYSNHVRGIVNRLAGDTERLKVLSLPELMQHILNLKDLPRGAISTTFRDVDWELGRFARRAIGRLQAAKGGAPPTTDEAYENLRLHGGVVTKDKDWISYLRGLPPFKEALPIRTHLPLLAYIQWQLAAPDDLKGVEHIIIDEAQDVTPLAWFLLDEINEADAWTILGDLNQRRCDHTLSTWAQVLEVIAIDEDTPIRQIKRGYRSTQPILDFANRLLPRGERTIVAFQEEGPAPRVEKARPTELGAAVVAQVDRLLAAYPAGTVAVISANPAAVRKSLRSKGWATARYDEQLWERNGLEVAVLEPDAARGLEFDAVVVVEPADFPENFKRQGPLYTALTRPNRELAVVYSKSLPDALRHKGLEI